MPLFTRVSHNTYDAVHERMNMFGSRTSSVSFTGAGSSDAGPRFLPGKPVRAPQRGIAAQRRDHLLDATTPSD